MGSEFRLGKNTIIILLVVQLTALLFTLMMGSAYSFTAVNCVSSGLPQQGSSTALCSLNSQVTGINATVHQLTSTFKCAQNPAITGCAAGWATGDVIPIQVFQFLNIIIGAVAFVAYAAILLAQVLGLMIFILLGFFPSLFSAGSVGAGLGPLGAGLGTLFSLVFGGATLVMLFYLLYLVVNRLPWFGKHGGG